MVVGPCSNRYLSTARCTLRDHPPLPSLGTASFTVHLCHSLPGTLCLHKHSHLVPIHTRSFLSTRSTGLSIGEMVLFLRRLDGGGSVPGLECQSTHLSEATQNLSVRQYHGGSYFAQKCRLHYQVQRQIDRDRGFRTAHSCASL